MITFITAIALLILGFFIYGKFTARFFGANDDIPTPVNRLKDGVDYIPMKTWKIFTIEFLNIAGLGPIFGAVLGAMYGPMAYVWIVFGCIFMGAVHDYFSGMLSIRNDGASLPEIVGKYLGSGFKNFLRIFSILLLIFVGVAFVTGPAGLLKSMSESGFITASSIIFGENNALKVFFANYTLQFWLYIIFAYYIIATLLPINKIIGRIYPIFGIALLLMAILIAGAMIFYGLSNKLHLNELSIPDLKNLHKNPAENILYPMLFVVISCGAISGFHSTQTPLMARCIKKESYGHRIFYGAMIAEGIVAIIWATAAMNFFGNAEGLNAIADKDHNPAWIVNEICKSWLGSIGAVFAILGVIACPITTGDTAFRSVRLMIADIFKFKQKRLRNRLIISIPLFAVGFSLSLLDFSTIWKYVGISNQILAMMFLWTGAMYLVKKRKNHLMLSLPALFLTGICITYLLIAPHKNGGLALPSNISYLTGTVITTGVYGIFLYKTVLIKRRILQNRNKS